MLDRWSIFGMAFIGEKIIKFKNIIDIQTIQMQATMFKSFKNLSLTCRKLDPNFQSLHPLQDGIDNTKIVYCQFLEIKSKLKREPKVKTNQVVHSSSLLRIPGKKEWFHSGARPQ